MKKTSKPLPFLFLALLLVLINLQASLVLPAFASPDSATYDARPTPPHETDLIEYPTSKWTLKDAANAYDNDENTFAELWCNTNGVLNLTGFTSLTDPWRIVKVDIKIKYEAPVVGGNDWFSIGYTVDPYHMIAVLQAPTDASTGVTLNTYVWYNKDEPNDHVWNWTDVGKIVVWWRAQKEGGADDFIVKIYEVWATVTYQAPKLAVDPTSSTVSAPFTVDINITNMDDLYTWEFNVTYDTSVLTATGVTEGVFLSLGGSTYFNNWIDDTAGWVYAYCTLLNDTAGVSGNGVLATISFNIDATGISSLDLHNSKLVEYNYVTKKSYNYPPNHIAEADGSVSATLPAPEFPLGAAMEIALVAVVIYVWWKSKREPKPPTFVHKST